MGGLVSFFFPTSVILRITSPTASVVIVVPLVAALLRPDPTQSGLGLAQLAAFADHMSTVARNQRCSSSQCAF